MNMTIHSTTKIVSVNGVDCRIWEGTTERGVDVVALIPRVMCRVEDDAAEFERDLRDVGPPSAEVASWPARLVW